MSMVTPTAINAVPIQGVDLSQFPGLIAALPDVQPFTLRSGYGYQEALNGIVTFLQGPLNDWLNALGDQNDGIANSLGLGLAAETASVQAQVTAILAQVVGGTQPQVNDATINAALRSANSLALAYLDSRYTVTAPAPSGGDDTAALQALFTAMMSNTGVGSGSGQVILRAGTYKTTGFTLNAGFWSGRIRGAGKQATTIQSTNPANPVFTILGSSGSISSGSISDLTIAGSDPTKQNGTGTVIDSLGGFQIERVQYENLAVAHQWRIGANGAFTEFCVLRDVNMNSCALPLQYTGAGSFHGSGIDGNSIINLVSGGELVDIGAGCNVYNSPLSLTVFAQVGSSNGNVIVNRYAGPVYFYGAFRMEIQGGAWTLGWPGGSNVYYSGTVNMWGGPSHLGLLFLVDKVVSTGTNVLPYLRPWNTTQILASGANPLMGGAPVYQGTYECSVEVLGPNGYWYSADVACWNSATAVPPTVTVIREHYVNDPNAIGKPVFTWNNGLVASNNNYNNQFNAVSTFTARVHQNAQDNLGQN